MTKVDVYKVIAILGSFNVHGYKSWMSIKERMRRMETIDENGRVQNDG
jgi:hypothetical protein